MNPWRNENFSTTPPFTKGATLFRIGGVVLKFSLRHGFMRRVQLVYGNFSRSAVFTELHEGGINRDAGQPGCKLGSSIKILEMDESIQKAVLRCVFRVFAVSHDPMDDTEDFCAMAFAKLPEGGSSSSLSGCDQLLLAPSSKIANH